MFERKPHLRNSLFDRNLNWFPQEANVYFTFTINIDPRHNEKI